MQTLLCTPNHKLFFHRTIFWCVLDFGAEPAPYDRPNIVKERLAAATEELKPLEVRRHRARRAVVAALRKLAARHGDPEDVSDLAREYSQ